MQGWLQSVSRTGEEGNGEGAESLADLGRNGGLVLN